MMQPVNSSTNSCQSKFDTPITMQNYIKDNHRKSYFDKYMITRFSGYCQGLSGLGAEKYMISFGYVLNCDMDSSGGNTQKTSTDYQTIAAVNPIEESKVTDFDTESKAFVTEIIDKISKKRSTHFPIPDGWKIIPAKTACTGTIK